MRLLGRPPDDPEVVAARAAAMATDPIRAILAAQHADGWWVKPGPGYAPKYTGTVWEVIFLDQLGRIRPIRASGGRASTCSTGHARRPAVRGVG